MQKSITSFHNTVILENGDGIEKKTSIEKILILIIRNT